MTVKKDYRCDLHIHSCLSPCADLLMTPGNIIREALRIGLDFIAITDHNSAGNVRAAMELARDSGLKLIPGMEVETREEVHLLCYFPVLESLLEWDEIMQMNLPDIRNDEEFFGYQLYTDENDEYIAKEERLLTVASRLSFSEVVEGVRGLGGMVVPAHVDRPVNSVIRQLGFIPPDEEIDLIEISRNRDVGKFLEKHPYLKRYSFIIGSDSHYLADIGKCGSGERGFPLTEELYSLLEDFPD